MLVDERIVVQVPKTVDKKSSRQKVVWMRKLVARSIMAAREKILKETQEDIFNVFVMTDCVEITIKGELETKHADRKKDYKPWAKRKKRK